MRNYFYPTKMNCNCLFWVFGLICVGIASSSSKLETLYEWKYVNITEIPLKYRLDGNVEEGVYHVKSIINYVHDKYFNYQKAVPFDIDKSKDGRVFVTIVGKTDVNVTLATVTNDVAENGPTLAPYPDHSWFLDRSDCSKLISVRSIAIDKCNRLWVLDSGRIDRTQLCHAKLLAFDLNTDTLLESHEMSKSVYENARGRGVLVNPVINTQGASCENTTVYIADSEGYALVVFDGKEFVRLSGTEYNPVMSELTFKIANETFRLPGGIVPMDLEPSSKRLFFAPLTSRDFSSVSTNELAGIFIGGQKPKATVGKEVFTTQPTAFRWSSDNVLFIGEAGSSIGCWRRAEQLCSDNFDTVVTDNEKLQYISALKVARTSNSNSEEELLVLSNRLQKSINRNRSFEEINYRILKTTVKDALEGTKCKNEPSANCSGTTYRTITY